MPRYVLRKVNAADILLARAERAVTRSHQFRLPIQGKNPQGGICNDRKMEKRSLGERHLVLGQGYAPHSGRLGRRRDRRNDAGAGAVACGFRRSQGLQIGSEQPLSGAAALGGKTAIVGLQMAADRINKNGGINGRPVELVIADDESKPDIARRKTSKMVDEENIDAHVGGFLSNICLACMPVWKRQRSST